MNKTKIKIGEIIEVEGKLYIFQKPKTVLDAGINEHGQILYLLNELEEELYKTELT